MAVVLNHSRARGTAKVVLLGIANHDGDGGAWPSIETLARYANVSPRNVQRALRELEDLGELRTITRSGGTSQTRGNYRPNLYKIIVTCGDDCDRSMNHRPRSRGGENVTPRGDELALAEVAESSPEPSLQPSTEPREGSSVDDRGGTSQSGPKRKRSGVTKLQRQKQALANGGEPLTEDEIATDYALLRELCKDYDHDDTMSVRWTLRHEHAAIYPAQFMQRLTDEGNWDGFVGNHGIGEYTRDGNPA